MPATIFNTLIRWDELNTQQQADVLLRPAMAASADISRVVTDIISDVRQQGDTALRELSARFDKIQITELQISAADIAAAADRLTDSLKSAMAIAKRNITRFHEAQIPQVIDVETQPGVSCQLVTRPVDSVGLYIPGGSAPLISTVLMLAIPAKIAGCRRIILCSPPPVADEILYAAQLCGVETIYQVGGAQAIAAMAFGTESITKTDKIFGPGNAYVTEAKRQVSQAIGGAAIDMPAGPSEVLVIADSGANPVFVAADLLSQAEHGPDSQVVLVTPDETLAKRVTEETNKQLALLSRKEIARQALAASRIIIARDLDTCVAISNQYGPEHLIIQTRDPDALLPAIDSAGSVFLG
uniref:histidinol dehydrogenase n=1 Tax=Morganella psychrotolerans TaxID=368603 RepID=UPI0039B0D846